MPLVSERERTLRSLVFVAIAGAPVILALLLDPFIKFTAIDTVLTNNLVMYILILIPFVFLMQTQITSNKNDLIAVLRTLDRKPESAARTYTVLLGLVGGIMISFVALTITLLREHYTVSTFGVVIESTEPVTNLSLMMFMMGMSYLATTVIFMTLLSLRSTLEYDP